MSRVPLASFRFPVSAIRLPQWLELAPNSELVLFVADFFHPVDGVTVELLLDGDMRHGPCLLSEGRLTTAENWSPTDSGNDGSR